MDIYSYLDTINPELYVGVDALTFTAKDHISATGITSAIAAIEDRLDCEDTKPFRYNGAVGWTKGPVAYATRRDRFGKSLWSILMVRGALAQEIMAYKIFNLKSTRIDLRVDVKMSQQFKELATLYYNVASRTKNNNARLIKGLTGETFYPDANREATYYGRLYDKSPEYGEDLGNVWRYEVEIKRVAADQIADIVLECHDIEDFITKAVFGIFKEQWAMPTPGIGVKPKLNYVGVTAVSTEKKLDWLRRTVAPSVKKLSSLGLQDDILAALGIDRTSCNETIRNDICTNGDTYQI